MTYKKAKNSNTKKIIIALSVLAFLGVALFISEKTKLTNFIKIHKQEQQIVTQNQPESTLPENKIDDSPAKPTDNDAINKQKETDPKQPTDQTPPTTIKGNLTISRATQDSDGVVRVRAIVDGLKSGSCTATLTNGSNTANATSTITYVGSYYSCGIIDIKLADFAVSGDWILKLKATDASSIIESEPTTVTVKK